MAEFTLDDRQYRDAALKGAAERASAPMPINVRYEAASGRVVVDFHNGTAFLVPARRLEGLEGASDEELSRVELAGETGLYWPSLDVDFTIHGIMQGIFGTRAFMDAARRGGQSKSAAKVAASRANGAKGGRPRKASSNE